MTTFLTRTPVIWALFAASILITVGFGLMAPAVGGQYLDSILTGAGAQEHLAAMTGPQRSAHFWITALLDTAYPLAYGGFFAAMALRFFGRFGKLAALPAFATIVVDLTENTVQALALSGAANVLDAKGWLTPLKFYLFEIAGVIAVIALVIAIVNMFRKKTA